MLEFTNAQIESLTKLFNDLLIVRFSFSTQQILLSFIETQNQTFSLLSIEIVEFTRQLRLEKIDYFDFEYEKKTSKKRAYSVMNANKYVFYRDVYIFTNRLKNLATQYDEISIRKVLIVCFQDFVLM